MLNDSSKRAFTVQSYGGGPLIDGVAWVDLTRHGDDGGALTELVRLGGGSTSALPGFEVRQINYSEVAPGAIKAYHLHLRQTDVWFVPPSSRLLCVLIDVRAGSRTEGVQNRVVLGDGRSRLLRIPPGVAHGCRNLDTAPAQVIYLTDLHFSAHPDTCDEGRLPWDYAGAEVWELTRG